MVSEPTSERTEKLMGRTVRLDIHDELSPEAIDPAVELAFGWLRLADGMFSTLRADSQVSILEEGVMRPGRAAPLVRLVLNMCARLRERTHGYFDVYATGRLDPSRYVRGWAIQRASAILTDSALANHRLRVGGDMTCCGRPGPDRAWRVAMRNPVSREVTTWTLPATGLAVCVCHSRHGHNIRDPMLRRAASGVTSVAVAGPDLGFACAYATAAVAMGMAALDWLPGLEDHTYLVVDDEGRTHGDAEGPGPAASPVVANRHPV